MILSAVGAVPIDDVGILGREGVGVGDGVEEGGLEHGAGDVVGGHHDGLGVPGQLGGIETLHPLTPL